MARYVLIQTCGKLRDAYQRASPVRLSLSFVAVVSPEAYFIVGCLLK
jgi:hypothetical protein